MNVTDETTDASLQSVSTLSTLSGTTEGQATTSQVLYTFLDNGNSLAGAGDFTATITWGDGSTSTVTSTADSDGQIVPDPVSGFDVMGSHSYAEILSGTFSVAVTDTVTGATITSADGAVAMAPATLTAESLTPPTELAVNPSQVLFQFSTSNPYAEPGDFTATIHWGDGRSTTSSTSGSGVQVLADSNGGFDVMGAHTYAGSTSGTFEVDVVETGGSSVGREASFSASGSGAGNLSAGSAAAAGLARVALRRGAHDEPGPAALWRYGFRGDGHRLHGDNPLGRRLGERGHQRRGRQRLPDRARRRRGFDVIGTHTYGETLSGATFVVGVCDASGDFVCPSGQPLSVSAAQLSAATGALTPPAGGVSGEFTPGQVLFHFTDANTSPDITDYTATISWGDGSTSTVTSVADPTDGCQIVQTDPSDPSQASTSSVRTPTRQVPTAARSRST